VNALTFDQEVHGQVYDNVFYRLALYERAFVRNPFNELFATYWMVGW